MQPDRYPGNPSDLKRPRMPILLAILLFVYGHGLLALSPTVRDSDNGARACSYLFKSVPT